MFRINPTGQVRSSKDDHRAGAHTAAAPRNRIEVHGSKSRCSSHQECRSRPAGKQTSNEKPLPHTARMFFQQGPNGRSHREFPGPRSFDVSADAIHFRPTIMTEA